MPGRHRRAARRSRAAAAVLLAAAVVASCRARDASEQARTGGDSGAPDVRGAPIGSAGTASRVGHTRHDTVAHDVPTWAVADVRRELETAGLGPVRIGDPVRQPFMSVQGTVLRVPGVEVQLFVYADAVARGRDTDRLDTARVAPPGMMITWRQPTQLVTSNNLAAIVQSSDSSLRHRVGDVLSARHAR